jgi:hypothetical protein
MVFWTSKHYNMRVNVRQISNETAASVFRVEAASSRQPHRFTAERCSCHRGQQSWLSPLYEPEMCDSKPKSLYKVRRLLVWQFARINYRYAVYFGRHHSSCCVCIGFHGFNCGNGGRVCCRAYDLSQQIGINTNTPLHLSLLRSCDSLNQPAVCHVAYFVSQT